MSRTLKLVGTVTLFVVMLVIGARKIGPAPALGNFLDPAHGVWSLARAATLTGAAHGAIEALGGDVQVVYDDRAVPHIFASTEEDAYRAMGYVVARDRLFQMYLQTMAASGRLTEIAGARALDLDRETRRLGMPRAAERAVAAQDTAGFMRNARAYSDGVNGYLRTMDRSELPLELRLISGRPPQWAPLNSWQLLIRMGWQLAYLATEFDRASAASRVGSVAAEALFPDRSPIQEPIQPNGQRAARFDFRPLPPPGQGDTSAALIVAATDAFLPSHQLAQLNDDEPPRMMASNNWAVSPRRSANGHALLEGDPHLDLSLPSIWYEIHLVVPGKLDVYGVTIPGAPAIVIGFNRDVAWTFTNTGVDVLDYYSERVDSDEHPTRYLVDGQWRALDQRIEHYTNATAGTLATDTLYFTHRGPLRRVRDRWLSMRWTVLEAGRELQAFYDAAHAKDAIELESSMARSFLAPAQNMLAADRSGRIAIRSTGRFPIRAGDGKGSVIRDGTTSASDWTGNLPVERYPQSVDPAQGYLASANQQPVDPAISSDWWGGSYDPWRALRINTLLRADSAMTPQKMQQFQTDPGSDRADLFVPFFLDAATRLSARPHAGLNAERLAEARKLLAEWDRRYTKQNTRAVLFEEAMRELTNRTWDELSAGDSGNRRVATPNGAILAQLLADSASIWWDDRVTTQTEHRDDIVSMSLVAALQNTRKRYGDPDAGGWRWDKIRFANINHPLRLPALSELDVAVQGGSGLLNPSAGTGTHGSSWRMVVELGPEVRAWATYPGGQSGNPASDRYRDRIPLWSRGELEAVRFPRTSAGLAGESRKATLSLTSGR